MPLVTETQTVDLAAWLTRIWDEEERLAKAATPGPWQTPGPDTIAEWTVYDDQWSVASATAYDHNNPLSNKPGARGPGYIDPNANAAFIAHNHPASVLARIAADRKILERYNTVRTIPLGPDGFANSINMAQLLELEWVLKRMAEPYADRPGYREEWRP
jgi:hypothetical protein